ncbi:MAG: hypothetical protein DRH12_07935 [Deltaproteobacteria bacterium]|nr:MAG: hypothetical protein DRH12_07935 [Deltaproteobacteria bacterium]
MSSKNTTVRADLIIRAEKLITMSPRQPVLNEVEVLIREGRIESIRPAQEISGYGAHEFIDARGCLVMPGLINAHCHAAMTLFRGLADDMPLKQWLFEKIFPAEARYLSPENVYWGAMLAFVEMISSGTTCFSDGYFFQEKTLEAAQKIGIRGLVAQGVIDFPAPGVPKPEKNLAVAKEFVERWRGISTLLTPSIFCHSPVTCSEKTLQGAMELCLSNGVPMQIHLAETLDEVDSVVAQKGMRPVHYLERLGILNETLIAIHCVHVDDHEMGLLSERQVAVVHCPQSNMKLASGVCPVRELLSAGIVVGLGTDGCASNNDLDMFGEMDTAAKLSKVASGDPTSLAAGTALKLATSEGAKALGLGKEIGSIEVGKRADIIIVDLGKPHLQPLYDPVSTLVYSAKGGDARDVIINGKVIMRNREIVTVDVEEVFWNVNKIANKISV